MQIYQKIGKLYVFRNRKFHLLLLAELVLLIITALGLIGKNKVYEYGLDDMTVRYGMYSEEAGGIYINEPGNRIGNVVDFENISLPRGSYRINLEYASDVSSNYCTVSDVSIGYKSLLTNIDLLYSGRENTNFEMWLFRGTKQLIVHSVYDGEGSLVIKGLKIHETKAMCRMDMLTIFVVSMMINLIIVLAEYDKVYGISIESKNVSYGLILIIIFASFPVLTDYLVSTGDTTFHLWRIEGMKAAILSGQFPVRISAEWQYGYGYAAPIFYGETFMLPAAFLRIIGFPIDISYRLYLIGVSAATVFISYYCFKNILKSKYLGLFSSALYSISIYRIHKIYVRGTLGEAIAMMFLPFLVYGFYKVFTEEVNSEKYKYNYIPLVIGFSGIVQSHLLTGEMTGAFTILLCIILWKKVLRKNTFIVLAKGAIFTCVVSAWFLIPMIDYMLTGDFKIQHASGRLIQLRGLYPSQLLTTFFGNGSNVFYYQYGMYRCDAVGIGMALTAIFGIWVFLDFFGHTSKIKVEYKNVGRMLSLFSGLVMLGSLSIFPWDKIQSINNITATLVSSLEFPDRLLSIANVCLALLGGIIGKYILEKSKRWKAAYFSGIIILIMCGSLGLMNEMLYDVGFNRIYNEEGMGFGYVSSGEYLPYGTDISQFGFNAPAGEGINVLNYDRNGLNLNITCNNTTNEEVSLEVPLLYYKGYTAIDKSNGNKLEVYPDNNFAVMVVLPPNFSGEVAVKFVSPWYWHLGECITAAALIVFAIMQINKRRYGHGKNSLLNN